MQDSRSLFFCKGKSSIHLNLEDFFIILAEGAASVFFNSHLMLAYIIQFDFSALPLISLIVCIFVGIILLAWGGHCLTDGAVRIANIFKISPLIIGLTVVSIATSMPELFTCLRAIQESADLALGSIVGSNIANIGLILGITAWISPLHSDLRLIQKELPFLLSLSVLFVIFAFTGQGFGRAEGLCLIFIANAYLYWVIRYSLRETEGSNDAFDDPFVKTESSNSESRLGSALTVAVFWVLLGGLFLSLGADSLVESARTLALRTGVSEVFVGLSVVALGTSLPELAASVSASLKKNNALCVGNVIGSNLFNMSLIGGTSAAFYPFQVNPQFFWLEFPLFIFATLMLYFFLWKKQAEIGRTRGTILLLFYIFVIVFIGLK